MKTLKWIVPALALGILMAFPATAHTSPHVPGNAVVVAAHLLPHDTMTAKVRAFKKEWNKKVDKLDRQIKMDQQKLDKTASKNKEKLRGEIQDMKVKRDELKKEISAAGNKTAAQWDEFKDKVSDQYDALNEKVKDFFNGD